MALPVRPPFEPMLAKLTRDMPSAPDLLYEPKWDGFRCVLFRDGDDLDLQSRNQKPLMRYFPELREPLLEQLPPQIVLDGELVIATPNGLNFDVPLPHHSWRASLADRPSVGNCAARWIWN